MNDRKMIYLDDAIDAFRKELCGEREYAIGFSGIKRILKELPSAQPMQRRGNWYDVGSLSCRCSECGCKSPKEYSYCPNCGADMREVNRMVERKIIYLNDAIDALNKLDVSDGVGISSVACDLQEEAIRSIENLPSAQPTLYGYDVKSLETIAMVLRKENMPPERVMEVLTDIGRIITMVKNEYEESLRKAVEQCVT